MKSKQIVSKRCTRFAGYGPSWNGKDAMSGDNIVLVQDDVQESRRRQGLEEYSIGLNLVNNQLKYTKINKDGLRYPLCMHGKPADGTNNAINVTPVNPSTMLKQKRKNKQKKIQLKKKKNLKKLRKKKKNRNRNNKTSNRRGRQGVDVCLATGNHKYNVIGYTILAL